MNNFLFHEMYKTQEFSKVYFEWVLIGIVFDETAVMLTKYYGIV